MCSLRNLLILEQMAEHQRDLATSERYQRRSVDGQPLALTCEGSVMRTARPVKTLFLSMIGSLSKISIPAGSSAGGSAVAAGEGDGGGEASGEGSMDIGCRRAAESV